MSSECGKVAEPRVLTNERIRQSPSWAGRTTLLPLASEGSGIRRLLRAHANAHLTWREAKRDDVLVLTDVHALTGSLYGLMPHGENRPTYVRADPLLTIPRTWPFTWLKGAYLRAALRAVDLLIVWAPAVIDRYAGSLGIPREKMAALKFHHTLGGFDPGRASTGDYVFSGGDSLRDYPTFFRAVDGLGVPVVVATRLRLDPRTVPANVTVRAVSHEEFLALVAGSRAVVFPLRTDTIRTSGQQSYLNAMTLAKPVIVTDTRDAPYYIDHGRTGLLTESGDAAALRAAIKRLLDDPVGARSMGEAARQTAAPLDQEYTWSRVLDLALEANARRVAR